MKKFIFIFLLSFSSLLGYAQLNEDFEGGLDTPDASGVWTLTSGNWLVRDNRTNTNPNWRKNVNPFPANGGVGKAAFLERENTGIGVYAEEWLMTPQVTLPANSQMRFFTRQGITGDDDNSRYQIRVSSDPNQNNMAAYTVLKEYTETELSTLTATQLDYEEKVFDLPFTGARYFAFVRVTTQLQPATPGDRWLVDDVKIVVKCADPQVLLVDPASITAHVTKLLWNPPATNVSQSQFEVQYGPTGFTLDDFTNPLVHSVPVTSSSTPQRTYNAIGLEPNIGYQFYVRSVCTDSNSAWVGPFNWNTKPLGRTCLEPIIVSPLPYSDVSDTSIYGNNIAVNPGNTGCGATTGYLGSNDVVYTYTAATDGNLLITMSPLNNAVNTGIFVYGSCAAIGNTCLAAVGNATSGIRVIPSFAVTAGQQIFIVISSTSATASFDYRLNIQYTTNCIQPVSLTVATPVTSTSATASWANGLLSTSTSWEIAVLPSGSAIPSVPGIQTNINSNYLITTTLAGAPLAPSTCYEYWVRADCGNGIFSPWSGPVTFCTAGCAAADQCNFTFALSDSGSNGWNNGEMQVIQGGLVVATLALANGGAANVTVPLCGNQPWSLFWSVGGDAPDEVRITVKNSFAQTIYAMTTNTQGSIGTTLYSGIVDCLNPLCLQPSGVTTVPTATITYNSAVIKWNTAGTSATTTTGFNIYVVLQGTSMDPLPLPTYTTTAIGPGEVVFTTPEELLPDTNYTVYIQAICTVNGPSPLTTATNFKTKERCPKPTALGVAAATITPFTAILNWTSPAQTSWQIIVQFASDPAPDATDPRWLFAANQSNGSGTTIPSQLVTGLLSDTQYEFYIRTNCGPDGLGGTIYSNPAGPRAFTTKVSCAKPVIGTTVTPTAFGGNFTWTASSNASSWYVVVLPAGSPAPLATDTGSLATGVTNVGLTYTYTYNLAPPLIPETSYVFYVRSDCGATDGLSLWAGPRAFTTSPTCFKPLNLTLGTLTAFTAELKWKNVAPTDAWQILALPVGSPAPDANTLGWYSLTLADVTFTAPDIYSFNYGANPTVAPFVPALIPETSYVFYIRGNCSAASNGISTWTGPRAVTTPPSCYKPTALTATNITPFTASLGWTNNPLSNVAEWQILVLPQGSPAPATTTQGDLITQNSYPKTGLTPNTCYDYYVRSSCGGVNGVSTWSGPKNFCTPPTCPQPTNASGAVNLEATATLTWTEPGTATNWDLVYGPPGIAIPDNNTIGIPLTATTFTTPNNPFLEAGFYEFYVRSHCSDSDKSFWTGPISFFIALPPAVCASVEIPFPTTSPGVIDLCPGETCIPLVGQFTDSKDTTTYTVLPVGFAPPFPFLGGIPLDISDDDLWGPSFTLPFNFCFYGVNYPSLNVGSNGVLTFNPQAAGSFCPWNTAPDQLLPTTTFPITNAIFGVYQDTNPDLDLPASPPDVSVNYQVLGVAPCRAFVVNYYKLGQFQCNLSVGVQTSQIVLYETSNIIEIYVQDRTVCPGWNEGSGVIGLLNNGGTIAHVPPGRNLGPWEAHNEGWRFTPDGASNVVFSWLKDDAFYSNDTNINICVSETTRMTAKAVYTGCGGQVTTKTTDVLLRVNELILPPIQDVQACQTYTLPALTTGNYFNQHDGVDPIDISIPITQEGVRTIYVYGQTATTPPCPVEISFTVTIGDLVPPVLAPVTRCDTYRLPEIDIPFNYYTGPNGTGTMYSGLGVDDITTSQTLYIYGQSGPPTALCTAQSTLDITIDAVQLGIQAPYSGCSSLILSDLPALPANNAYYTQTGGPNGTGVMLQPDAVISESQTVYIYAQSGTCTEETSFTVDVFGVDAPTLNVTQPTCAVLTGTIEVTAPVAPGGSPVPGNLFISEVTDAATGSLTYVELFNGTGAAVDLSNYKLKFYTHGAPPNNINETLSCNLTLSGIIANNSTNVIKVSTAANQGGIVPNQSFTGCGGVNNNDNIRLTTIGDVVIDVFGRTDGVIYTPSNATGYTYRRSVTGVIPSLVWIPADWTALDPEDYTDIGHSPFVPYVYQYSINGPLGPWQYATTFPNVAIGDHTIYVQEILTGCINHTDVSIVPQFDTQPITTITYPVTTLCNNVVSLAKDPAPVGFAINGQYTANPNTLLINASTGVIDVAGSPAGTFVVTYTVLPDVANCIAGGSSDFTLTIDPILTPDFPLFSTYCTGTAVPDLSTMLTSPNGVTGTWSPAAINNLASDTYTFYADAGQCAVASVQYNVVISNTAAITPTFNAIQLCPGELPIPALQLTSNNNITGTWSPNTIDNTQTGTYLFTPDNTGQCATVENFTVTVLTPTIDPTFNPIQFCPGTTPVPTLPATSTNSITGMWSPTTIDNTQTATYVFTPDPGQCAIVKNFTVTVLPVTIDPNFAAIPAYCAGETTALLPTTSIDNITGVWSPATIDNTQTGNYVFTPNPGQCAMVETITVTITPSLEPDFDDTLALCSGAAAPALASTSPNGIAGTWSPNSIDATQSGTYTFTPTLTNQCYTTHVLEVTVASNPVFGIDAGCINGDYTLAVTPASSFLNATFIWRNSLGVVVGTTSSIIVTQVDNYTVEVTNDGCSKTEPKNVVTISCQIQKGISPRGTGIGDGKNDYFNLEGQNVTKLEIFNRYGSKVYTKSNYTKEWYGQSDNGDELPDGTYFYVIERASEKSRTGWIYINHEL